MNYLFAFLGICLVIFVHELGHFLAARFCGVRVETFSIGMGPRVISWVRGDTRYQIALLPLGGYVKMAGEEMADPEDPSPRQPKDDELTGKSVGARFLIFSGGVIMNILFGLVVFPIVFFVGVPFEAPVIGSTDPGSPAWEAGLEPGTTVLEIEGDEIRSFNDITTAVALGPSGPLEMKVLEPSSSAPRSVFIEPDYHPELGLRLLGVRQAYDENMKLEVAPDSPAALAGIQSGDSLLAVEGAAPTATLMEALVQAQTSVRDPRLEVETPGQPNSRRWVTLARETPPEGTSPTIGITPLMRRVHAVRGDAKRLGLAADDLVLTVAGEPVRVAGDFERLVLAAGDALALDILRGDERMTLRSTDVPNIHVADLALDVAIGGDLKSNAVRVVQDSPAWKAGLRTEDRIVRVAGNPTTDWTSVASAIRAGAARGGEGLQLEVFHQEKIGAPIETKNLVVTPTPSPFDVPLGLRVHPRQVTVQATGLLDAIDAGVESTWHFLAESWVFLKRVVSQDIAASNAGGIITIGAVSSHWAGEGLAKLFFFLALLSMNLAFLNILPVPLLDGGHLFFLLIEKLKGSPVSPRIQLASQGIGMVLLLSLMVYVTVNDVMRWLIP